MNKYLIRVETARKQLYIFGSNRLRENIGASHLIAVATENWVEDALNSARSDATNLSGELAGEIIYSGGGGSVLIFDDETHAKEFTRRLSRRALVEAPAMQLLISRTLSYDDQKTRLADVISKAIRSMDGEFRSRIQSTPHYGLGATVMCRSTGLPANHITDSINGDPGYPASPEIEAKWDALDAANQRLTDFPFTDDIRELLQDRYQLPSDFDQLGGTRGEMNFIAVVHADGDGMGNRIQALADKYPDVADNETYLEVLRTFSTTLNRAATTALQLTVSDLISALPDLEKNGLSLTKIGDQGDQVYLPIRPLVFGGDDVTFVCDGRIGLWLALRYLEHFETQANPSDNEKLIANKGEDKEKEDRLTACAGVAIVKTHFPFARAYELAEQLCKSAKDLKRKKNLTGSCIDWHFAFSGLSGDLDEIRQREYHTAAGDLMLRPVALKVEPDKAGVPRWEWIKIALADFQLCEQWMGRHNKIKALRDALRAGPGAVQKFWQSDPKNNALREFESSTASFTKDGWLSDISRRAYFDAVELVDLFLASPNFLTDGAFTHECF